MSRLPGSYAHWTVRHGQGGIAAASALKMWRDHGLAPHRWHSSALSNDMAFAEKLHDVVGLYAPPNALVLPVDQRSWIQTLYHSPRELPLKRGRGVTKMHDYKRTGTTTRFTAPDDLDASVIRRDMQRHRNQ